MSSSDLTRREFLVTGSTLVVSLVTAVPSVAQPLSPRVPPKRKKSLRIWRWSGRGRRVSQAALKHAANRRYATKRAALSDLPHPGANLRLVQIDISKEEFIRLFIQRGTGRPKFTPIADLRKL